MRYVNVLISVCLRFLQFPAIGANQAASGYLQGRAERRSRFRALARESLLNCGGLVLDIEGHDREHSAVGWVAACGAPDKSRDGVGLSVPSVRGACSVAMFWVSIKSRTSAKALASAGLSTPSARGGLFSCDILVSIKSRTQVRTFACRTVCLFSEIYRQGAQRRRLELELANL